ncbi:hypothetical protein FACS189427_10790 [Planctomycetales bacterium]|nr:hypothetical protein FACS189427_10790 [Planctomycetales bacterium]
MNVQNYLNRTMTTDSFSYKLHAVHNSTKSVDWQDNELKTFAYSFERYEWITEISYGFSVYPLRNNGITACCEQLTRENNSFYLYQAGTMLPVSGCGTTKDAAKENWQYEFHKTFQELSAKLDWERSEEDQTLWNIFESIVDVPAYRRKTPVNYHQTGKIIVNANIPSHQREIEWLDDTTDVVSCRDCPDLLRYKTGQYFRADLLREYQTGTLIKIRSISPTKYRDYTDKEIDDFVALLPTTEDLPPSTI